MLANDVLILISVLYELHSKESNKKEYTVRF